MQFPLLYLRVRYWELLCRIGARDVRTAVIIKEKQMKSLKQKTLEYSKMYVNSNYWKKMGDNVKTKRKRKNILLEGSFLGDGWLGYKNANKQVIPIKTWSIIGTIIALVSVIHTVNSCLTAVFHKTQKHFTVLVSRDPASFICLLAWLSIIYTSTKTSLQVAWEYTQTHTNV